MVDPLSYFSFQPVLHDYVLVLFSQWARLDTVQVVTIYFEFVINLRNISTISHGIRDAVSLCCLLHTLQA